MIKKIYVLVLKKLELGSAVGVRLTKITGKSKHSIHPKHLIKSTPWFLAHIKKKDVVLDLGCGNGQNVLKASKKAKYIIGIDFDQKQLDIAKITAKKSKIKNVHFKQANLEEKLTFKKDSFDTVIFLDVLEHLEKRDQVLKELSRILKPKGKLILGVPNSDTEWKRLQRSVNINSFSDPDHKIEYSETKIRSVLKKHRFKVIHFAYGKFDTPLKGVIDAIGGLSLTMYKAISKWRLQMSDKNPKEASGFEIVAQK